MEFREYLMKQVRKILFKRGRVVAALTYQYSGYMFQDESIDVYFIGEKEPIQVMFSSLPYSMEEFGEFHSVGYVLDMPSSQRKVKKDVYVCVISNGKEKLIIESRNPNIYEQMRIPYEAIGYIPDRILSIEGESIQLNTWYSSIGHYADKRVFANIVAYSQFKDTARIEPDERFKKKEKS